MCIIIVKPENEKLPSREILDQCKLRNKDGFGFCVPNKPPFKTMKYNEFILNLQKIDESQPCIIHFRFATHGTIKKSNCHPFKIDGVSFAHNGVLQVDNLEGMTDSETAFKYILHPSMCLNGFATDNFSKTVASIIGGSKFAFLSDRGQVKLYGNFIKDNGLYFSNDNYKPYNHYYRANRYSQKDYISEMYPEFIDHFEKESDKNIEY